MMQCRCSGSHMVGGSCSCGWFDYNQNNSFSMLFPSAAHYDDQPDMYSSYNYASSSSNSPAYSSSSVDCTLSLGTPSTRSSNVVEAGEKRRSSCVSNFCGWKILQPKSHESSSNKSNRGSNGNSYSGGGDALSARRCANCDTTTTPLWRNGPKGPKSLCNACGIRYKKEERRASAAAAAANSDSSGGAAGAWSHHSQNQKIPYFSSPYGNEYSFMEDDQNNYHHDSDSGGLSFLPWRLNVADRPGLVHDFTR